MPSTNDHDAPSPQRSLWLEVHHEGRSHVFCCAANEERAIVLGSLPRADIRVSGPGIAPVHFHFERDRDCIMLVPTYNAEVRVNAMLVRGPVPIPQHAVVEFAGIRIEALVRATPQERVDYPSLDIPDRESGISYLAALPTDTQTTKLALDPFPRVENLQAAIETRETPLEFRADVSRTQRIERLAPELQTTQVMARLQIVTAAIPALGQHTARMVAVAAAEPPLSPPPPEIPSSPAGLGWQETTAFDLDGLKADLAPTPVPQPKAQQQQSTSLSSGPAMPAPPRAAGERSPPPLTRSDRPPPSSGFARPVSWLGERTKAQPVAMATIALGVAVTLALLTAGVSHVVGRDPRTSASSHALAIDPPKPNEAPTGITRAPTPKAPLIDTPTVPVAIAPTPPSPASAEQRGRAPGSVPATTAAAHLVAGRYVQARAAYAELGTTYPENPAYQAMNRLLERRTSGACTGTRATPSCPEIVQ